MSITPTESALAQENGISYHFLTAQHEDAAFRLLSDVFRESEPIIQFLACDKDTVDKFFKVLWSELVSNDLSIVAINDETKKVVGVTTLWDRSIFSDYGFCKIIGLMMSVPRQMGPFIAMTDELVELALPSVLKEYGLSEEEANKRGVMAELVTISVDQSMGKRGIGGKMV